MNWIPKCSAPVTQVVTITPQMAEEALRHNVNNRRPRPTVVRRYAEEMRSGTWRFTHQGIAFDSQGQLVDGQHRLHAIATSKTTQSMMVTFGLPRAVHATLDTGIIRNPGDVLDFEIGIRLSHQQAAALRVLYMSHFGWNSGLNRETWKKFAPRHVASVQWAVGNLPLKRRLKCVPLAAVIVRASYIHGENALTPFFEAYGDGVASTATHPGIKLRDWLLNRMSVRGLQSQKEIYYRANRAVYAFCRGETLSKLYEAPEELLPFPWEQ